VPVLAFLCFIAWERRGRELLRWELWLGALLPLACISGWVLSVGPGPTVHRPCASCSGTTWWAASCRCHGSALQLRRRSSELAWPVLRRTATVPAALDRARRVCTARRGRGLRQGGAERRAWRFALCAALPGLLLLSFAATGRSIYAAPCMIGFVLLMALWLADAGAEPAAAQARRAISITALLIALLALLVLGLTFALQWSVERAGALEFVISAIAAAAVAVLAARQAWVRSMSRAGRRHAPGRGLVPAAVSGCFECVRRDQS